MTPIKRRRRWILQTALHTLEVVALVLAIILAIVAVLFFRLAQGPMSLETVRPGLSRMLANQMEVETLSLGPTRLEWFRESQSLGLSIDGLSALDAENRLVLRAQDVAVGVSLPGLLRLKVTPGHLAARNLRAVTTMSSEGRVGLGHTLYGAPTRVINVSDLVLGLVGPETRRYPSSFLKSVNLQNARISFHETDGPISWLADVPAIRTFKDESGIGMDAEIELKAPEVRPAHFALSVFSAADSPEALVDVKLDDFRPRAFVPSHGRSKVLHRLDLPVSVKARIENVGLETLNVADIFMTLGAGDVVMGERRQAITRGQMSATLSDDRQTIALQTDITGQDLNIGGTGRLEPDFDQDGRLKALGFQIDSQGQVNLSTLSDGQVRLSGFSATGLWNRAQHYLRLRQLRLAAGGGRLQTSATIGYGQDHLMDDLQVQVSGEITDSLPARALIRFWPGTLFPNTRAYLDRSVLGGDIADAQFDINLPTRVFQDRKIQDQDVDLTFAVRDGRFQFMRDVEPISQITASGKMTGRTLKIDLQSGRWGGGQLRDAEIWIPKMADPSERLTLSLTAAGPAEPLFRALNGGGLRLAERTKIQPERLSGQVTTDFKMTRPLKKKVTYEDLELDYTVRMKDARLRHAWRDFDAQSTAVTLKGDQDHLSITGFGLYGPIRGDLTFDTVFKGSYADRTVKLSGLVDPETLAKAGYNLKGFVDGSAKTDVNLNWTNRQPVAGRVSVDLEDTSILTGSQAWAKTMGQPGYATIEFKGRPQGGVDFHNIYVDAAGLRVNGQAQLAESGQVLSAAFPILRVPETADLTVSATRGQATEPLDISVTGNYLDGRGWLKSILTGDREKKDRHLRLEARLGQLRLSDEKILQQVQLQSRFDGGLRSLRAEGQLSKNETWTMAVTPKDGVRQLSGQFDDAGLALSTFLGITSVQGGQARLRGTWPENGALALNVEGRNIKVRDVPALATLISVASIRGLGNALSGEGLAFDRVELPLTLHDGVVEVGEARARGPGLGITTTGLVRTDQKTLALSGSLAPAYGINAVLGNIPLLGDLLVSRKGEGIVAFTYKLTGPIRSPQAVVNPLSVLTPGVFRRIFEFSTPDAPGTTVPEGNTKAPESEAPQTTPPAPAQEEEAQNPPTSRPTVAMEPIESDED